MRTRNVITTVFMGLFIGLAAFAQDQAALNQKINKEMIGKKEQMNTYVIERDIPGAGEFTSKDLAGISAKSNAVLTEMGPDIKWVHSYVTEDKVYCIYKAKNEELLRQHAEKGGFPITKISEFSAQISPETAKD